MTGSHKSRLDPAPWFAVGKSGISQNHCFVSAYLTSWNKLVWQDVRCVWLHIFQVGWLHNQSTSRSIIDQAEVRFGPPILLHFWVINWAKWYTTDLVLSTNQAQPIRLQRPQCDTYINKQNFIWCTYWAISFNFQLTNPIYRVHWIRAFYESKMAGRSRILYSFWPNKDFWKILKYFSTYFSAADWSR